AACAAALRAAAAEHAAQQPPEEILHPAAARGRRRGLAPACAHATREVGQDDRRQHRQQLADEVLAAAAVDRAEAVDDLALLLAEHVADDLLAVVRVDL